MARTSSHPLPREAACGRAPGKVILLGEHAAVYGRPAIAAAIDRWLQVELTAAADGAPPVVDDQRLALALVRAAQLVDANLSGLSVQIASDLPRAMGLGSSAAVSVALLRAFAARVARHLNAADASAFAFEVETIFHGTPSGVDNSAVAYGGVIG
ncbi:MAG TPA: hydroxymethylglutaryl-CoA reductase, partial [Candidatus Kryptonia bacterium]|nr:hydroxymethylglutaryl-CoA reductase [Candidatus Kryptonia bacterium]